MMLMILSWSARRPRRVAVVAATLALAVPQAFSAQAAAPMVHPIATGSAFSGLTDTVVGPDGNLWGIYQPDVSDEAASISGYATDTGSRPFWKGNLDAAKGTEPTGVGFDKAGSMYMTTCPEVVGNGDLALKPGSPAIEVHAQGTSSTAAAVRTITGSKTRLKVNASGSPCNDDVSMAVATDGTVYVLTEDGSVLVFAPGANGNVAPARVISGSKTGLADVNGADWQLLVGTDGSLYVGNVSQLRVFAPKASGNAAPVRVISTSPTGSSVTLANWSHFQVDNFGNLYAATTDHVLAVISTAGAVSLYDLRFWSGFSETEESAIGRGPIAGIDRNRRLRLNVGIFNDSTVLLEYGAVVPRAPASLSVSSVTAPTSSAAGSASVSVSATAKGGTLSGNVRFVLSAKGQSTQTVTVPLSGGGGAPSTGMAKAVLPKLAKGAWTLRIAYGGNGDFAPADASRTIAVK